MRSGPLSLSKSSKLLLPRTRERKTLHIIGHPSRSHSDCCVLPHKVLISNERKLFVGGVETLLSRYRRGEREGETPIEIPILYYIINIVVVVDGNASDPR